MYGMRGGLLVALAAVAACDARLGPMSSSNSDVDAAGGGSNNDASSSTTTDAPTSSAACANGRVVYLEFEGVALAQASGASDATKNKAVWLGVASATLTKFRPNATDRTQQIADVTSLVKQKLANIPQVTVVTTRPAAGPYFMVGFGDVHTTANVPYLYAVNRLDCGDSATKSDLAWVFEDAPTTQKAADFAVGSILFGLGATGTNDVNDCMCGWLTPCQPSNTPCTLGTAETASLQCPNQTNPQNEVQILQNFCQ